MFSGSRPPATPGASARVLGDVPDPAVVAAGPPPAPELAAPWSVRAVEARGDELDRVVGWMAEPHVAAWWHQDWPAEGWVGEVGRQLAGDHSRPWTVWLDGEPVAYVEVYRVARDVVAPHLAAGPHDLGVHLAIGDGAHTGRGLGREVLRAVSDGLGVADRACRRIVGDPAADHRVARRAFAAAGFTLVAEVDLPHKRAALMQRSLPAAH
jgi:RimJ/RimL family protein N-acetyltransferase